MKKLLNNIRSNMTSWILSAILIWFIAATVYQGRKDSEFRDRFNKLEAEIKTYEAVKILDARQEDRLKELLAELESCRPPDPDPTPPDCRR